MRFFSSQNNLNKDYHVNHNSDYPQTVEIPTSSTPPSTDDDHDDTMPNNNNNDNSDDDDEGYDEFIRICMNSVV